MSHLVLFIFLIAACLAEKWVIVKSCDNGDLLGIRKDINAGCVSSKCFFKAKFSISCIDQAPELEVTYEGPCGGKNNKLENLPNVLERIYHTDGECKDIGSQSYKSFFHFNYYDIRLYNDNGCIGDSTKFVTKCDSFNEQKVKVKVLNGVTALRVLLAVMATLTVVMLA